MTTMFLEQRVSAREVGIQPPVSSRTALNPRVARLLGIEIPPEIFPFLRTVESATGPAGAP